MLCPRAALPPVKPLLCCSVNLSYGTIAGPHDGTGQFEAAIEELISARQTPLRVGLPAGNHYLARCHASFALPKASPNGCQVHQLQWRAQPDSRAASFMEIWLPADLAHMVVRLSERDPQRDGMLVLEISQQSLSEMVGISRESTNKLMSHWAERNWIRVENRHLVFVNVGALKRAAKRS